LNEEGGISGEWSGYQCSESGAYLAADNLARVFLPVAVVVVRFPSLFFFILGATGMLRLYGFKGKQSNEGVE